MKPLTPQSPFVQQIIEAASQKRNVVIDGFCGYGGVTDGFEELPDDYMVIACINHWPIAISTHKANHPLCLHLEEDFRTADLSLIDYMVREIRKRNPGVTVHGWFSLECTNFSNAKGGMTRDADSRTLADHVYRYILALNPDVIWIENVKEFLLWGPMIPKVISLHKKKKIKHLVDFDAVDPIDYMAPLIKKGHVFTSVLAKDKKGLPYKKWLIPDPAYKAQDFNRWLSDIKSYGYDCEHRLLNCADFGVPQHRIRLIMQFNRKGIPAAWPTPTHHKKAANGLPKWLPVRDTLDLHDEGPDVLSFITNKQGKRRPRIASKKTITRLMNGCTKHVVNDKDQWVVKHFSGNDAGNNISLKGPAGTVTAKDHHALVTTNKWMVKFLSNNQKTGTNNGNSVQEPAPTVTTQGRVAVATAQLISQYYRDGGNQTVDMNDPMPTVATKDRGALVTTKFLDEQYTRQTDKDLDGPSGTVMGNPKQSLVAVNHFIDQAYSGGQQNKSLDEPAGTVLSKTKASVVEVNKFMLDTQFDNAPQSLDRPAQTITANRKHFYIVSAQFNNPANSIDNPSPTILARMDKKPPYLVVTETGQLAIEIYKNDPKHYKLLKKFMAENGIISIKMRMLNENELKRIMTIPEMTIFKGTRTDHKKMIGNAVPPKLVTALAAAHDRGSRMREQRIA